MTVEIAVAFLIGMAAMAGLDHFVFPVLAHRWADRVRRAHVRFR